MTMDDAAMLGTLNDPELALKRIYDKDQGVLQEELESDSEQSIDFEKELKQQITSNVDQQILQIEKKINLFIGEHEI